MTEVADPREAALEPLRASLLARARLEADQIRASALEDGRRLLAQAGEEADAALAQARAEGEADAAALLAVEHARTRRAARGIVLREQSATRDELRQRASAALKDLLDDPDQRTRLAGALRRRLGEQAAIREHPDGGLVARSDDGRTIDASIRALVDGAVAELDVERLWTDA